MCYLGSARCALQRVTRKIKRAPNPVYAKRERIKKGIAALSTGPFMTAPASLTFFAHGAAIPALGFGTSPMTGGLLADTVVAALKAGYRHIDTARKYGTERAVGDAMRASGVRRAQIFLTTKVSHENLRADDFARSVDESLGALRVDYVDLLLVHWPNPDIALNETMSALALAKRQGLARHIGVANFNIALLDQAIKLCPEPLVALQAEYHPYLDQSKLLTAVRQRGLVFIAYCPLGRGRLFNDRLLGEIGNVHRRSIAQVALRWLLQQNVAAIPRSSNPQRIADNFDVFNFTLTDDEMKRIHALKRPDGRIANAVSRVSGGWD
jgi:2,5-diketo-D-gluconate reductase B